MPTLAEVRRHQGDIAELVRLATIDLDVLWRDVSDAVVARELLAEVLPELTAIYGEAAASLAADWYDEIRELEAPPNARRFSAQVATLPPREQTDVIARFVVGPMFSIDPNPSAALDLAHGSLQRLIADMDRGTTIGSSISDPSSNGWRRVTDGNACDFCRMLSGRGAVYREATVNFGAHDHCGCSGVPSFGDDRLAAREFVPSTRNISPADRQRAREWMRANGYGT